MNHNIQIHLLENSIKHFFFKSWISFLKINCELVNAFEKTEVQQEIKNGVPFCLGVYILPVLCANSYPADFSILVQTHEDDVTAQFKTGSVRYSQTFHKRFDFALWKNAYNLAFWCYVVPFYPLLPSGSKTQQIKSHYAKGDFFLQSY